MLSFGITEVTIVDLKDHEMDGFAVLVSFGK